MDCDLLTQGGWRSVLLFLALLLFISGPGQAIDLFVQGLPLELPASPLFFQGEILVPLEALRQLGGSIAREGDLVTVRFGGEEWKMEVASPTVWRGEERILLSQPLLHRYGLLFVPLAFFAESLGLETKWDGINRQLHLVRPGRADLVDIQLLRGDKNGVELITTGPVDVKAMFMEDPFRIVLDLAHTGLNLSFRSFEVGDQLIRGIRVSQFDEETVRVVLDLFGPGSYRLEPLTTRHGIRVWLDYQITGLIREDIDGTVIRVRGTVPGDISTFYLKDPARWVLDFHGGALLFPIPPLAISDGLIRQVRMSQFDPQTVRLVLDLERDGQNYRPEIQHPPGSGGVQIRLVPHLSGSEVVEPEVETYAGPPGLKGKRIVIDPGHGGMDSGATGPSGLMEKDVALSIALTLAKLLQQAGAEPILTRSDDRSLTLENRVLFANRSNAEAFVSVHANGYIHSYANGTETYHYYRQPQSARLAQAIQGNLLAELGLVDRGVKENNFHVLRWNQLPAAVLVEVAFITSPDEERLLADPEFRNRAAQAIFRGIEEYFSGE